MPGGHNFRSSKMLLGLKCCDVKGSCFCPPKAAVLFKRKFSLSDQQSTGLIWAGRKEQKLEPLFILCFIPAAGLQ